MPAAITVAVYALAVARLTRLVTEDRLTEGAREAVVRRLWARFAPQVPASDWDVADKPLLVYLATCPWCVSVYVGAAVAPLVYWFATSPWLLVPALALAFSQVTGLLAQIGG